MKKILLIVALSVMSLNSYAMMQHITLTYLGRLNDDLMKGQCNNEYMAVDEQAELDNRAQKELDARKLSAKDIKTITTSFQRCHLAETIWYDDGK